MLVGGAPNRRDDHAVAMAAAALDIRASVPLLRELTGEGGINVRIGLHSGPVTAGVIGYKNPRWHLFGWVCMWRLSIGDWAHARSSLVNAYTSQKKMRTCAPRSPQAHPSFAAPSTGLHPHPP